MKSISRFGALAVPLLLMEVLSASWVSSQPTAPVRVGACGDSGTMSSYAGCPLLLVRGVLFGGADRHVIARASLYRPIPLSVIVNGDSARHYALLYEHEMGVAGRLMLVARRMLLGATAVALACPCFLQRSWEDHHSTMPYEVGASTLMSASVALLFIQFPYRRRALEWADKAIWWHDAMVPDR